MKYEVEQKFRLASPESAAALVARVVELGGTWREPENHSDTYYAHPCRDFRETDEALRIRSIDDQHFVTYKGPKINKETKTRRELELPLAPPSFGPQQLGELWQALGFTPVETVKKTRRKASLSSEGWLFSVDLDEVAEVGVFAELDTTTNEDEIDAAQQALLKLAETLDLKEVVRKSYLGMLLESRGA